MNPLCCLIVVHVFTVHVEGDKFRKEYIYSYTHTLPNHLTGIFYLRMRNTRYGKWSRQMLVKFMMKISEEVALTVKLMDFFD